MTHVIRMVIIRMRVMRIYLRMKTQSMKVNASEKPEQDGNPSAAGSGECHSICPGLQQDYLLYYFAFFLVLFLLFSNVYKLTW